MNSTIADIDSLARRMVSRVWNTLPEERRNPRTPGGNSLDDLSLLFGRTRNGVKQRSSRSA
jgi:hypothetical protein